MTGISGSGKSGKQYNYYTYVNARKGECPKKSVPKDYIEDLVIAEMRVLLTNERIDQIAKEVVTLSKAEAN